MMSMSYLKRVLSTVLEEDNRWWLAAHATHYPDNQALEGELFYSKHVR